MNIEDRRLTTRERPCKGCRAEGRCLAPTHCPRDLPRPTADTDPGECRWCLEENFGCAPCPYHGEGAHD